MFRYTSGKFYLFALTIKLYNIIVIYVVGGKQKKTSAISILV